MKLGIYEHYKGGRYELIGVAKHSETLEDMVVYKALYTSPEFGNKTLWVRPKKMFTEKIMVNNKKIARFRYIDQV